MGGDKKKDPSSAEKEDLSATMNSKKAADGTGQDYKSEMA